MTRKLFVNLPVRDLERSKAFFAALGFTFNPQFTDQNAACMIVGPDNYAMLLTEAFFAGFTPRPVADARQATEVLVAFDCASRAEVDELAARALAAGGGEPRPARDYGFMYQRTIEDPDGHLWEPFWMDPAHVQS